MIKTNAAADVVRDVELFRFGTVSHPAGDFEVDQRFAAAMLKAFAAMRSHGYYPPVLAEHNADGTILGIVRDLRLDEDRGRIVADLEFADGIKDDFDAGRRRYFSPSFYDDWQDPHTGEEFHFVLREVSAVSVPHLKNIEPPITTHYTLFENGFAREVTTMGEQEEETENAPTLEETVDAVLTEVAALRDRIAALEGGDGAEDEEAKEDMGEQSAELAALKSAYEFVCAVNAVREELPTASREVVEDFARLRLSDPDAYKRLKRLAADRPSGHRAEIGYVGNTPTPITADRAHAMADEAGVARGVERIQWMSKRFGSQIFEGGQ